MKRKFKAGDLVASANYPGMCLGTVMRVVGSIYVTIDALDGVFEMDKLVLWKVTSIKEASV